MMSSSMQITPREAGQRVARGAAFVDVRDAFEYATGMAAGAVGIPRDELERNLARYFPDRSRQIVLICQSGGRSLLAAEALRRQGYLHVYSVDGGTALWNSIGLPMTRPVADIDHDFHERYARHLSLPEIGPRGQRRLEAAQVFLLGAGGLGSPAALYLAAAGVGRLHIVDDDVVERSNLQRQILHADADIGVPKVESAQVRLLALNPRIDVMASQTRLDAQNVERLIGESDVVIDGSDNFPARYLLNDACVRLAKPLVHGAIHRFHGQVAVFDAGRYRGRAPCYRCLFPQPPAAADAPNCSQAGVLGVLPGIVGALLATEAIKSILDIGQSLSGRLLHLDALTMQFRQTWLEPDPDCPVCAPEPLGD